MISEKQPQPFPCALGACVPLPPLYRACTHAMVCRKFARNRPCVRPNMGALEAVLSGNVPLGEPEPTFDVDQWAAEAAAAAGGRRRGRRSRRRALNGAGGSAGSNGIGATAQEQQAGFFGRWAGSRDGGAAATLAAG